MRLLGTCIILFCLLGATCVGCFTPEEYIPVLEAVGKGTPAIFAIIGWVYALATGLRLLEIPFHYRRIDSETRRHEEIYFTELMLSRVDDGSYYKGLEQKLKKLRANDD